MSTKRWSLPTVTDRARWVGLLLSAPAITLATPIGGLTDSHISVIEPSNTNFVQDVQSLRTIGSVTALIPEASTADEASELLDGESGDTAFPYMPTAKALATIGEYDPVTGQLLTGYPDGQAAWLANEDTVRVAYQSESYGTMSSETYPWVMANGAQFTGSHIHTIDYDRSKFADFLSNPSAASEMFKASGKLFDTVYNVFGDEVAPGGIWGNQALPNGTKVPFDAPRQLSEAEFFFHSFCGAHYEIASKYGVDMGFADNAWLLGEEWNIQNMFGATADANDTMGLASMVVDVDNGVAYTVPALGQTGYEKLLPMNPGSSNHVVIICAGYNHNLEPAPLKVYVGMKGVDADGVAVDQHGGASERDKFLARNGLLYGKIYGLALANSDFAALNLTADADTKMMDAYLQDGTAPETFSARFYPTSYKWSGWGTPNAVAVKNTEMGRWLMDGDNSEPNEQPTGYTFFNGDSKAEHPAVDPDITKHRYIQNLTYRGGLLALDFSDMVSELNIGGLPAYLSVDCRRVVSAIDGALTLDVGGKGVKHGGVGTASTWENGQSKTVAPDGLQWIRTSDADVLIVDEDSGNEYGERKFALVLNPETLELAEAGKGYFLAQSGGSQSPRAAANVSAYGGTYSKSSSSEFSGSWNVTGLIAKKSNGDFYTMAELAGTGEQTIIEAHKLSEQSLIGVVQMKGESGGPVSAFRCDQGGQIFMFNLELPTLGGQVIFDPGTQGSSTGGGALIQDIRAGVNVSEPMIQPKNGWIFAGWDQQFDSVSGDLVVRAQYVEESAAANFGLYTENSIVDLRLKGQIGELFMGYALLNIHVDSGDLVSGQWTNEIVEQVWVPAPADAYFYRLNAE